MAVLEEEQKQVEAVVVDAAAVDAAVEEKEFALVVQMIQMIQVVQWVKIERMVYLLFLLYQNSLLEVAAAVAEKVVVFVY